MTVEELLSMLFESVLSDVQKGQFHTVSHYNSQKMCSTVFFSFVVSNSRTTKRKASPDSKTPSKRTRVSESIESSGWSAVSYTSVEETKQDLEVESPRGQ